MITLEENQDVSSDGAKPTKVGGEVNYPEWQRKGHAYKNIQHQEGVVVYSNFLDHWQYTVWCLYYVFIIALVILSCLVIGFARCKIITLLKNLNYYNLWITKYSPELWKLHAFAI